MKYEHECKYGTTHVSRENGACRKCRPIKGGQPKKVVNIMINNVIYDISTSHKLYSLRYGILTRCYNAKPTEFANYQGKGINVCDEWRNNPESFYLWALENGWKAGMSIDRIDSSKDYEPTNCQFITFIENCKKGHKDTPLFGENHGASKLTTKQVIDIKKRLKLGEKCIDIARLFNVDRTNISCIKLGKSWNHVTI
jgi:hypothetical protein